VNDHATRLVTLSEVYHLDMGRYVEDIGLWRHLVQSEYELVGRPVAVVEVGSGDGRIPAAVASAATCARWTGVEVDGEMVRRSRHRLAHLRPFDVVTGDASDAHTWGEIAAPVDLVIVPFSTFYLFRHDRQVLLLEQVRRALRPGGSVAIVAFAPRAEYRGPRSEVRHLVGPDDTSWVRLSTYLPNPLPDAQTTSVRRLYGPPEAPTMRLEEMLYWRRVDEWPDVLARAGFDATTWQVGPGGECPLVPAGQVLVVAQ